MAATAERLVEAATRHAVLLERLKSGEAQAFATFLAEMDRTLRQRLARGDLTAFARGRAEAQIAEIEGQLAAIYDRFGAHLKGRLLEIGEYEAGFEARSLDQVMREGFTTTVPGIEQIRAAVLSRPLSVRGPVGGGKLLEPFVRDWSRGEVTRVGGAIRQGFFEGATNAQIVQRLRGTRANRYRDGILAISSRNAEAIVRTAVQHASSAARQATWDANGDIVKGVRWVSTLDARTTQQCRSLDGRIFPVNKGPRPPIHIRCRSTTVAALDERFAFLREGATRASKDGPVPAGESYYSWLKKQPAAFQDTAIGPVRGKLLRDGGLTAERFAEINIGKHFEPLSLEAMRKLEPLAFERAAL